MVIKGTITRASRHRFRVIISGDGYIVTNNHVKDVCEIEITLNNKKIIHMQIDWDRFKMDIALLKLMMKPTV
jgi:S1-C subfamily serine protease